MTAEELQTIKARCEAATPGPWDIDKGWGFVHSPSIMVGPIDNNDNDSWNDNDAAFIASARTDIPALLEHIEHQRRALEWFIEGIVEAGCVHGERNEDACPFEDTNFLYDKHD